MASTHTPQDAMDFAKRMIYNEPVDAAEMKFVILNLAADEMYFAKAWDWSVGELDTITLANNTDDYSITSVSDFLHLIHGEILHKDGTIEPIRPAGDSLTSQDNNTGIPRYIARTSATNLRLKPTPIGFGSGAFPDVVTFYKKTTTRITSGNVSTATTLPFPDEYFSVYCQFVLFWAFRFAQDSRAGSMQPARQGVSLPTGQLSIAMNALEVMKAIEPGLIVVSSGQEAGRSS